ncbi:hypothetical protein ACTXT7_014836, partial [Hymenolepis weldensis]
VSNGVQPLSDKGDGQLGGHLNNCASRDKKINTTALGVHYYRPACHQSHSHTLLSFGSMCTSRVFTTHKPPSYDWTIFTALSTNDRSDLKMACLVALALLLAGASNYPRSIEMGLRE